MVDCDPVLAQPDGKRKPPYSRDLMHLNPTGYAALNQALAPVLDKLIRRPAANP